MQCESEFEFHGNPKYDSIWSDFALGGMPMAFMAAFAAMALRAVIAGVVLLRWNPAA